MALGAWWLIIAAGALWRRTVWRQGAEQIRAVQQDQGGELVPVWCGFELRREPGVRVCWRGGLRGPATLVWSQGDKLGREPRWLGPDGVRELLQRPPTQDGSDAS